MERTQKINHVVETVGRCPKCSARLVVSQAITCTQGHTFTKAQSGQPVLMSREKLVGFTQQHDQGANFFKTVLKAYPRLYYFVWWIFCPVWTSRRGLKKIKQSIDPSKIVLDIGSGPRRIFEYSIAIDVIPFDYVDLVADATDLPFTDGSVDVIVSESVLEHVKDPARAVREMLRVLKPGGTLYVSVPFLTPYHPSPEDYTRWTHVGLSDMLSGCEQIEVGADAGPWSALLVFISYWLGSVLAMGSRRATAFTAFLCMLILGPLKVFDYFFVRLPGAESVAAQLYITGKKPPVS